MRCFLALLCTLGCGFGEPSPTAKTVLLISVDTLRADHLGFYGYPLPTSPELDRLAEQGIVFEDASSTSPWTLPAHASLLTGLTPATHGVTTWKTPLPADTPTLVHLLETAGFETGAIATTIWLERSRFGLTESFDRYLEMKPAADRRSPNRWVSDEALRWIRERDGEPLFLFLHFYDVHADYASEEEYEQIFVEPYSGQADGTGWQLLLSNLEDEFLELCQENFDPSKCRFGSPERPRLIDRSVERIYFDAADTRHLRALYDAGIRQIDAEIGRLVGILRAERRLDETLLIVTSDHGEEFMEHGRVDHFITMHQEVLRVPLLIRGPGIPRGVRVPAPVSLIDLAPTIVEVLGYDAPSYLEGIDLSPLWTARSPDAARRVFDNRLLHGEASGGLTLSDIEPGIFPIYRSVRRGNFKLIDNTQWKRPALYDLSRDPGEANDLASREPELARELTALLRPHPDSHVEGIESTELDAESKEALSSLGYLLP